MEKKREKAKVAGKVSDALRDQRKEQLHSESKGSFMEEVVFEPG